MPNWCEGWIKFRGSKESLMKFIKSEFNDSEPVFEEKYDELMPNIPFENIFLNSLVRSYVSAEDAKNSDDYICFGEDGLGVFCIKIKHAWCVNRQGYPKLAKKYGLDIRGKCYECGMNFAEEFEYKSNGDEVLYNVHEFEDYIWECECPTLGG
jgi:hypothetical protein